MSFKGRIWASAAPYAWAKGTRKITRPPIYISGAPRSGTTWVLETLEKMLQSRRHGEPLMGSEIRASSYFSGKSRPVYKGTDGDRPLERFIDELALEKFPSEPQRVVIPYLSPVQNFSRIANAEITILKFTAAQRMVPLLLNNNLLNGVVILRNPLSIIASVKKMYQRDPEWSQRKIDCDLGKELTSMFPQVEHLRDKTLTNFELIAINSIIDTLAPVARPIATKQALFASYEGLCDNPNKFYSIIECLGLSELIQRDVESNAPSSTVRSDSDILKGGDSTVTWKKRLTVSEIDKTLELMEAFGLNFYSEFGFHSSKLDGPRSLKLLC